ncbi:hypothetical protein CI109_101578 [Kwoniella shandongensis]|uniref:Uncharacterized protein n=1 Tax=Kwoniella shandongensis TaxID=1734106 RepID=A0A5M6C5R5_9TREE|nr:uncharacterized protein CI109_001291 [Kwoniella shandongensis]KAA5530487.1 hypothetical protein CI109_001291 [Kwoniella shandongensis]
MVTARQIRRHPRLVSSILGITYATTRNAIPTPATSASLHTHTPSPIASTSYLPYRGRNSLIDVKGKGRAYENDSVHLASRPSPRTHASSSIYSIYGNKRSSLPGQSHLSAYRSFHATARRDAIPLIPAGLVFLKGTSILTLATAFSRILISFFPIGTLAAFKMARMGKWITEVAKPTVPPEVDDFWRMWCEDEKPIELTKEEADYMLDREPDDDGGIALGSGRIAYSVPMPPMPSKKWFRGGKTIEQLTPQAVLEHQKGNRKRAINGIRRFYFSVPDLPPLSQPYYNRMSPTHRQEVDSYRRYWIGLKKFKACFKNGRILVGLIFMLPVYLLLGVYIAGLERVPLTGRWRLILLTPEEEDSISTSLAGANWYRSVINLLTTAEKPAPPIMSPEDWRWTWVQGVLSRLEQGILSDCEALPADQRPPKEFTPYRLPPPSYHPLKPRPRASSLLHGVLPGGEPSTGREHLEIGPPYNLMLMEKDERNAFSYGFGGQKAGGIVVFSGLLESILREGSPHDDSEPPAPTRGVFSSLFSTTPTVSRPRPQPTEDQTLHLACVLAHEMGHLLLSHHLETLSQQQVLWPSVLGLTMDLVRAFIWPFTVILGPTVNDALANMGKTSTDELIERFGEIGFQRKHEFEADLVGLRILALAGFDPQTAVDHFSGSVAGLHEIEATERDDSSWTGTFFKLWAKASHPSSEQRTEKITQELARWEKEAGRVEQAK